MIVTMDDKMVFILGTIYVIFNALVLNAIIRFGAHHNIVIGISYDFSERCKQFFHDKFYFTLFFLLTGEFVWISLFVLMKLPNIRMTVLFSRILATGIHVPFVLLVCMLIARELQKPILRKWGISENDVKQSIFYITLFMDIFFIGFNWETALFVMAILIGKYIWLDCTYADVVFFLERILKAFRCLFEILFKNLLLFALQISLQDKDMRDIAFDSFVALRSSVPYSEDEEQSDVADIINLSMMTATVATALLYIMFCLLQYVCLLLHLNNN